MTSLRLVLADDEPLVLQGLRMVLEGDPDFEIVGEAPDGRAALQLLATVVPDMVLTDIRMPRMDGIELTRRIRGSPALTEVRVVVLTTFAGRRLPCRGGARGSGRVLAQVHAPR